MPHANVVEGVFQVITEYTIAAVDCGEVTSGLYDETVDALDAKTYGQQLRGEFMVPAPVTAILANLNGQICLPDSGAGISFSGWAVVGKFNFSEIIFPADATSVDNSEWFAIFDYLQPDQHCRFAVNVGGENTLANPFSYWTDLGVMVADTIYYNNA